MKFIEVTIQKMTAIVWVPHLVQVRSALEIMRAMKMTMLHLVRNVTANCIPKLFANKRKHMEKQLSPAKKEPVAYQ